ncbi:MAG: hypothetical protein WKF94_15695 [Solirubrobacteraceae bacterium]
MATWAGEIEVVRADAGSVWETIMGRRPKVFESGDGRLENRVVTPAQAAVFDRIIDFIASPFDGNDGSTLVAAGGLN